MYINKETETRHVERCETGMNILPLIRITVSKYFTDHVETYIHDIMSKGISDPTGTFKIGVSYDFTKGQYTQVGAYHPRVVVKDRLDREHPIMSQLLPDKQTIDYYIGLHVSDIQRMRILYNIRETIPELTEEVIEGVAMTTFQAVLSRHE